MWFYKVILFELINIFDKSNIVHENQLYNKNRFYKAGVSGINDVINETTNVRTNEISDRASASPSAFVVLEFSSNGWFSCSLAIFISPSLSTVAFVFWVLFSAPLSAALFGWLTSCAAGAAAAGRWLLFASRLLLLTALFKRKAPMWYLFENNIFNSDIVLIIIIKKNEL